MVLNDLWKKLLRNFLIIGVGSIILFSILMYLYIRSRLILYIEDDLNNYSNLAAQIISEKNDFLFKNLENIRTDFVKKEFQKMDDKIYFLKNRRLSNSQFQVLGISDTHGNLYIPKTDEVGYRIIDIGDRTYYKNAMSGYRSIMATRMTRDPEFSGEKVTVYAVPISKNGNIEGVFIAAIHGDFLYEQIKSINLARNRYLCITNKDGIVIASTDRYNKNEKLENMYVNSKCSEISWSDYNVFSKVNKLEIKKILWSIAISIIILDICMISSGLYIYVNLRRVIIEKNKEIQSHRDCLEYEASIDELTNVYNRRYGLKLLKAKLDYSLINNVEFTVAYIDIDNLKLINDKIGHNEGDRLISTIASFLVENLKDSDVVARLGGDEFIVGLYECNLEEAKKIIKNIQKNLDLNHKSLGFEYPLIFSYGLVQYDEKNHKNVECMIKEADSNMYFWKNFKKK